MRRLILFFICCLALNAFPASLTIKLPVGCVVSDTNSTGETWRQNGYMRVAFALAVKQFSASLQRQGWHVEQYIEMGKEKKQAIMTWQRGGEKVTLMLWKINITHTGFAWGENKDK